MAGENGPHPASTRRFARCAGGRPGRPQMPGPKGGIASGTSRRSVQIVHRPGVMRMRAIPVPLPSQEEITGLACPECFGVLMVVVEGSRSQPRFRCRIGHSYTASEVIMGKERRIEEHLWAAVTLLNELSTVLRELVVAGKADEPDGFETRAHQADEQQEELRRLIEEYSPTKVGT